MDSDEALLNADNYEAPRRAPKSEKRQRASVVSVRLTPEELHVVEERAEAAGVAVSTYMRLAALRPPAASAPAQPVTNGSSSNAIHVVTRIEGTFSPDRVALPA